MLGVSPVVSASVILIFLASKRRVNATRSHKEVLQWKRADSGGALRQ